MKIYMKESPLAGTVFIYHEGEDGMYYLLYPKPKVTMIAVTKQSLINEGYELKDLS